ncbi:TPA: hypothetical protein ACH3X1_010389 [Trebouxia sp. C0004]
MVAELFCDTTVLVIYPSTNVMLVLCSAARAARYKGCCRSHNLSRKTCLSAATKQPGECKQETSNAMMLWSACLGSGTFGGSLYYIVLIEGLARAHYDIFFVQDLRSLAQTYQLPSQAQQNLAGIPATAYTVYPYTDMHNALDLRPAATPCCVPGAANATAVQTCAATKGLCCVALADLHVNADSTLAGTLANVCDTINYDNNIVCQGFVYDHQQKVAFFKGGINGQPVNTSSVLCSSPTSTAWLRDTATTDGTVRTQILGSSPAPPPPSGSGTSAKAKTAYGVIAGVLAACVPAFTWLAITYSYRMEKHMVVSQVVKNVKEADIASDGSLQAVNTTSSQSVMTPRADVDSNMFMNAMQGGSRTRSIQRINSAPSSARRNVQHANGSQSELLASPHSQPGFQSLPSDILVQNPLLGSSSRHNALTQHQPSDRDVMRDLFFGPTKEMQSVAKQITVRCLRRWDGLLGIRAGSDGLGRRSGIWRDKFDGVRYGVLLLAMRKLNADLLSSSTQPTSIQTVWQQADRKQRVALLNQLVRKLQNISEEEAQAITNKDPESPGIYDRMCSMFHCCGS